MRSAALRKVVAWAALVAVGGYGVLGPWINPSVEVANALRLDLVVLATMGFFGLRSRSELHLSLVSGGLLGAAFVAPWAAFPWLILPALALGRMGGGPRESTEAHGFRRPTGLAIAVALLALCGNAALMAAISARGLRVSVEEMEARDFRANSLLEDVPVHDAWAIDLTDRPSPTVDDLIRVFKDGSPLQATPAFVGLSILRGVVGGVFGWEDPRWSGVSSSFLNRLTDDDRDRSTAASGQVLDIWRVLYAFPQEAAVETLNGTAHVAVIAGLGEELDRTRLFLSFRVREVNWTTRIYMRLIDPARRWFVYPSLLRQFAHTWNRESWSSSGESLSGEGP
jgi:hypothetical protein